MIMWQDKYETLEKQFSDFMNDKSNDYKGLKESHGNEIKNYQEKLNKAETQVIEYNFLTKNLRKENSKWLSRIFVSEKDLQNSKEEILELKQQIEQIYQEKDDILTDTVNQAKEINELEEINEHQLEESLRSDQRTLD